MKIRILKTTVANKQFVKAGEIIEVSEADAKLLIGINKAEAADGDVVAVEAPAEMSIQEELTTETANAVIETKAKTKRRAK